jgi:MFS family permease
MADRGASARAISARSIVAPLALAQFVASYAATNMNVALSTIAADLATSVHGMQTAITTFTLTMAALMIPGSRLTDRWGRTRCFRLGLMVYGTGAVIATLATGLGVMIVGYSLLEGVGSALMIPPIYILVTVSFTDLRERARWFGVVSGAAGLGSAAGPLLGGLITSGIGWRASFVAQVLIVGVTLALATRLADPPSPSGTAPAEKRPFDLVGSVLSAVGLGFVVFGILQSSTFGWGASRTAFSIGGVELIPAGGVSPVWAFIVIGVIVLAWFYRHLRGRERAGRDPLIATRLFHNRTSNRGLVTQLVQWATMQGTFFVLSVFLQQAHHFSAIETGIALSPATVGILASSAVAGRLARRRAQATLVRAGFAVTCVGMGLMLALVRPTSAAWTLAPGLLLMGVGVGVMLTSSVNVVQTSFPDSDQGDISGLSRSVSNLGSSFGTALAGSVIVAAQARHGHPIFASLVLLLVICLIGLAVALTLPRGPTPAPDRRRDRADSPGSSRR